MNYKMNCNYTDNESTEADYSQLPGTSCRPQKATFGPVVRNPDLGTEGGYCDQGVTFCGSGEKFPG